MRRFLYNLLIIVPLLAVTVARAEDVLSWEACVAQAAQYHPDMIVAREGVVQAQAGKTISQSASLPQVSAVAGAQRASNDGKAANNFSAGLQVQQTLFDAGKKGAATAQAGTLVEQNKAQVTYTTAQVRYNLRAAYVQLWQQQELVKLLEEIKKIRKSNAAMIELRYQAGSEHRGALLSAQAKLAQADFEIAQAARQLDYAQLTLSKAMGLVVAKKFVVGELSAQAATELKPDFEALAKQTPSYKKAIAAQKYASLGVTSAKSSYWPTVNLSANAGEAGTKRIGETENWSAGVSLSYALFDGQNRSASLQQARSAVRSAVASTQSALDGITKNIEKAWNDLEDAQTNQVVQESFLASAKEREKIAEAQYNVGLGTFDNWTIIEDNFVSAQKAALAARAQTLTAQAAWLNTLGQTEETL